jgi:GT2 family glycosyltransferase
MTKDVSVIIVSYQTADLIGPCLSSVINQKECRQEVIVVDNASTDGSPTIIAANFPSVRLIVNKENQGFAVANNQALPLCRGRYLLFLNPDTILQEGCLAAAITFMSTHPEIGLAGLQILNPDGSGQESISYQYLSQRYTSGELAGLPGKIAAVMGAAMIAPRRTIKSVGGFDADFFLYGEDEDLCLRIRRLGFFIGFIPGARVIHYHGQSERRATAAEVWRKKIRAEYLFYRKHYRPETIARISRWELIKSNWRILTLHLGLPFMKNKTAAQEKIVKYSVLKDELRSVK